MITTLCRTPATWGLLSFSDCRTSTGPFTPSRCAIALASVNQISGAGFVPLQTDRPLSNQQNRNQPRTATEPTAPRVPRVPEVPEVPKAWFGWVPCSRRDSPELGTAFRTMPVGSPGAPGTDGTAIRGTSGARRGVSRTATIAKCQTRWRVDGAARRRMAARTDAESRIAEVRATSSRSISAPLFLRERSCLRAVSTRRPKAIPNPPARRRLGPPSRRRMF